MVRFTAGREQKFHVLMGFPGGSQSKESACNAGDLGSIPGWGRSPEGRHGNPLQYFCLENSRDRGAWQVTVQGVAELDTTEWLSTLVRKSRPRPTKFPRLMSQFWVPWSPLVSSTLPRLTLSGGLLLNEREWGRTAHVGRKLWGWRSEVSALTQNELSLPFLHKDLNKPPICYFVDSSEKSSGGQRTPLKSREVSKSEPRSAHGKETPPGPAQTGSPTCSSSWTAGLRMH